MALRELADSGADSHGRTGASARIGDRLENDVVWARGDDAASRTARLGSASDANESAKRVRALASTTRDCRRLSTDECADTADADGRSGESGEWQAMLRAASGARGSEGGAASTGQRPVLRIVPIAHCNSDTRFERSAMLVVYVWAWTTWSDWSTGAIADDSGKLSLVSLLGAPCNAGTVTSSRFNAVGKDSGGTLSVDSD